MGPDPPLSHKPVPPHDAPGTGAVTVPGRTLLEEAWALTALRELRKIFEKDHDTENPKCLGQIPMWCELDPSWFPALHPAKKEFTDAKVSHEINALPAPPSCPPSPCWW